MKERRSRATPHNAQPIGTGPFIFKEWVRGSHLVFERNPNYWDAPKPYLDRIIVRFFTILPLARSHSGRTRSISSGDYPVPYSDIDRLRSLPQLGIETGGYSYARWFSDEFNLENPFFSKLEVRQAIAHAVDKQAILDDVWYGWKVSTGPISHYLADFYTSDVPSYGFDLDPKSQLALLDQAGYPEALTGHVSRWFTTSCPWATSTSRPRNITSEALSKVGMAVTLRNQVFRPT